MAALAKEETSSADFLALGNALEAISTKEKADRERDERGAANAAKREKRTTKHEWKRVDRTEQLRKLGKIIELLPRPV
jgi:hypothetical protein